MDNNDSPQANPYSAPAVDLSDELINAENLAGRGARLGAAIIDTIIMSVVVLLPTIMLMGGWQSYVLTIAGSPVMWKIVFSGIGFIAFLVVNGVFLARDGQSLGKKAMGIKIVRNDGSKADLARIVLRRMAPIYLSQCVPYLGALAQCTDVLCIFRESRRCLHDDIADTKVINA